MLLLSRVQVEQGLRCRTRLNESGPVGTFLFANSGREERCSYNRILSLKTADFCSDIHFHRFTIKKNFCFAKSRSRNYALFIQYATSNRMLFTTINIWKANIPRRSLKQNTGHTLRINHFRLQIHCHFTAYSEQCGAFS